MIPDNQRQRRHHPTWIAEVAVLLVLGAVAAAVVLSSLSYQAGSVLYPLLIGSLLLLLVLLRLAALAIEGGQAGPHGTAVREADDEGPREDLSVRSTTIYAAAIIALVASLHFVWFPVAASVAGIVVLRCVYSASWRLSVLGALFVSASSSAVFWGLGATLPGPGI